MGPLCLFFVLFFDFGMSKVTFDTCSLVKGDSLAASERGSSLASVLQAV